MHRYLISKTVQPTRVTFDGYLVKLDRLERLLIYPNPNNDIAVFEKPLFVLVFPRL